MGLHEVPMEQVAAEDINSHLSISSRIMFAMVCDIGRDARRVICNRFRIDITKRVARNSSSVVLFVQT